MTVPRRTVRMLCAVAASLLAAAVMVPPQAGAVTYTSAANTAAGDGYVAMGSSFAAGPGILPQQTGSGAAACSRSLNNYAGIVARDTGADLTDVTCSGATTANILTSAQGAQPPQIDAVTGTTRRVTVTIGGNDVNYLGSLGTYSCQTSGGTSCGTVDQTAINQTFEELADRLVNVVTAVHDTAPQAQVYLVNYFTILPDTGTCTDVPLTADQLAFERSVATRLADATATAATATGATLVDLATAGRGHDACSSAPWVETYRPASGRVAYHPNEAGMEAAAALVESALGTGPLRAGFTRCAGEGGTCSFSGTRAVAYGAGTYTYETATGSTVCANASFGGDPAVNVLKSCYVAGADGPPGYTTCAAEGGTCTVPGTRRDLAYGAGGNFAHQVTSGSVACTDAQFGDPAGGVVKSCYVAEAGGPPGSTVCATEGGTCPAAAGQPVAYGAYGAFATITATGDTPCTNPTFGDPIPGVSKACYTFAGGPSGYTTACSDENSACAFSGQQTVAYGARGRFTYRTFTGGTPCTTTAFGTDPLYGVSKTCYLTP
ncbi:SGNH/GDSL hydrolase family protein [Streptomyces sp. NPDC002588]|uniref:SGNH/GDSL hydrolase family protein n=1 Tax=Streptomyces sp. NPDC002588 TaxID=3154419 RepID=UPI00331712F5